MAKSILIVDDSVTERKAISGPLRQLGYQVSMATDGDEGLKKANGEMPDLIVLDVVMPKKNGFQVCRKLKMSASTKHIKIIMLTSKDQETDRFWGMRQGADAYLTKPVIMNDLVTAIGNLI